MKYETNSDGKRIVYLLTDRGIETLAEGDSDWEMVHDPKVTLHYKTRQEATDAWLLSSITLLEVQVRELRSEIAKIKKDKGAIVL